MKRAKIVTVLLLSLFAVTPVLAEEITITVRGMVCSFCAQGIKKTFSEYENVKQILVDLDNKVVQITTSDGTTIADEEIRQKITDAGYEVASITRGRDV